MAKRISEILLSSNAKVMVVVGAGHKDELMDMIVKDVIKGMMNGGQLSVL
ncbi:MAG: hypothetical protein GWP09_00260 [Nitrospiraceae bacterium]|nr:hypothetical protein [Nitrospiraceae bacterium]